MPLDELEIGVGVQLGQVRTLRQDIYEERLRDLQLLPPQKPVEVVVWNPSAADPSVFPSMLHCCAWLSESLVMCSGLLYILRSWFAVFACV